MGLIESFSIQNFNKFNAKPLLFASVFRYFLIIIMSTKNGTQGLSNPLANPNKDYDLLHKIVLIGDSGKTFNFKAGLLLLKPSIIIHSFIY